MFVILIFIIVIPVGWVLYWLGRGVTLNQALRAHAACQGAEPDSLVNLKTGEVLDPGTKAYDKAVKKSKVAFE